MIAIAKDHALDAVGKLNAVTCGAECVLPFVSAKIVYQVALPSSIRRHDAVVIVLCLFPGQRWFSIHPVILEEAENPEYNLQYQKTLLDG